MGKKESFAIAGRSENLNSYYGNQHGGFSHIKNRTTYDPATPLPGTYPKDSISYHRDICTSVFITANVVITISKNRARFDVLQQMNGQL